MGLGPHLEALYERYNRIEYIDPDPLWPVLQFSDPRDREVVGLIASSLAFGNVRQILNSIGIVLERLPHPRKDLLGMPPRDLRRLFRGFRHRYVTGTELAGLLAGTRRVLREWGTLGDCFARCVEPGDETFLPALGRFVTQLRKGSKLEKNYLLPDPGKGSACKRLLMYLRWMVRDDAVDLGLWRGVSAAKLIVPMDTHMHRMSRRLGLTQRRSADMRTALEVTRAFRQIAPGDPVRYDFALTRLGIREDTDLEAFVRICAKCA